jgi:hypothetical protein
MPLLLDSVGRHTEPVTARVPLGDSPRTLDDLLSDAWEGLVASRCADCPACGSKMTPRWSAGAGVVGGRCGNCGSELA